MRRVFLAAVAAVALAVGCGSSTTNAPATAAPAAGAGKEQVEERVVVERLPDGRLKKTTIRTTRRAVPAAPPPARPADPYPPDPRVRYNVERVNAYRAQGGLPPLLYDAKISEFARRGSEQYARDHVPHAHFAANARGAPGFGSRMAENQGDPRGVPALDPDPRKNGRAQIDAMLRLMMDEGPGGGHHDNIMEPAFRRIGVGLVDVGGRLFLTNDFSD